MNVPDSPPSTTLTTHFENIDLSTANSSSNSNSSDDSFEKLDFDDITPLIKLSSSKSLPQPPGTNNNYKTTSLQSFQSFGMKMTSSTSSTTSKVELSNPFDKPEIRRGDSVLGMDFFSHSSSENEENFDFGEVVALLSTPLSDENGSKGDNEVKSKGRLSVESLDHDEVQGVSVKLEEGGTDVRGEQMANLKVKEEPMDDVRSVKQEIGGFLTPLTQFKSGSSVSSGDSKPKSKYEAKMEKKQKRLIRNRMSAQLHRQKKKQQMGSLSEQVTALTEEIQALKSENKSLVDENGTIKKENSSLLHDKSVLVNEIAELKKIISDLQNFKENATKVSSVSCVDVEGGSLSPMTYNNYSDANVIEDCLSIDMSEGALFGDVDGDSDVELTKSFFDFFSSFRNDNKLKKPQRKRQVRMLPSPDVEELSEGSQQSGPMRKKQRKISPKGDESTTKKSTKAEKTRKNKLKTGGTVALCALTAALSYFGFTSYATEGDVVTKEAIPESERFDRILTELSNFTGADFQNEFTENQNDMDVDDMLKPSKQHFIEFVDNFLTQHHNEKTVEFSKAKQTILNNLALVPTETVEFRQGLMQAAFTQRFQVGTDGAILIPSIYGSDADKQLTTEVYEDRFANELWFELDKLSEMLRASRLDDSDKDFSMKVETKVISPVSNAVTLYNRQRLLDVFDKNLDMKGFLALRNNVEVEMLHLDAVHSALNTYFGVLGAASVDTKRQAFTFSGGFGGKEKLRLDYNQDKFHDSAIFCPSAYGVLYQDNFSTESGSGFFLPNVTEEDERYKLRSSQSSQSGTGGKKRRPAEAHLDIESLPKLTLVVPASSTSSTPGDGNYQRMVQLKCRIEDITEILTPHYRF